MFKKLFSWKKRHMGESAFGKTDIGRVRANNEDSFLILQEDKIYILSDGMGGHKAGEVASSQAVQAVQKFFANKQLDRIQESEMCDALMEAMTAAHHIVADLGRQEEQYTDMGCTLVTALIRDQTLYVCHSGDSRAYIINSEAITQITTDHSVVMELVAHGALSREEARTNPLKNQITQGVGLYRFEPECCRSQLKRGDLLLLCTDGLWDMLTDDEIQQIAVQGGSAENICTVLIDAANSKGGEDNITVIIVKPEE